MQKIKNRILITGGAGFLGGHLIKYLLGKGNNQIVVFDKLDIENKDKNVVYFKGDIALREDIKEVFKKHGPFSTVCHLAASMPDKSVPDDILWKNNVLGTKNLIEEALENKVNSFVFTSSNVAYGIPKNLPVGENADLNPLEIYGKSKAEAEKQLAKFKNDINIQVFRCPVISGIGRLGLQAILFEFISENKNVYMLGDGSNKYQFIDAVDVCSALEKATHIKGFDIYNIGADEILSLREIYQKVIEFAQSSSKIVSLPKGPALIALSVLNRLNISPLGIYQYTMLGRSLYEDTAKIKKKLRWNPKKTNLDTFLENYKWYIKNKGKFAEVGSGSASSNRSLPKMGVFKLLKMIS